MGRGTPKTLNSAISNAFHEFNEGSSESIAHLKYLIKKHVLDWQRHVMQPIVIELDDREIGVTKRTQKAVSLLVGKNMY